MFDWVVGTVERAGAAGVFLLMLVENLFPPIPSELVMPLAGFVASRGQLGIASVVVAGTAGSLLGALFWYGVGRYVGRERLKRFAVRHGRWLTLGPDEVDRAGEWFARRGALALFLGRLVPGVRTLISVPAGISGMPVGRFLAYSVLGTALWTGGLAYAGFVLGQNYGQVAGVIEPVGTGVLVMAVAAYLYRVATFRPHLPSRQGVPETEG